MSKLGQWQVWLTWGVILAFAVGGTAYVVRNIDLDTLRRLGAVTLGILLLLPAVLTWEGALETYSVFRSLGYKLPFVKLCLVQNASLLSTSIMPAKVGMGAFLVLCKAFLDVSLAAGAAEAMIMTMLILSVNSLLSIAGIGVLFAHHDPLVFVGMACIIGIVGAVMLALDLGRVEPHLDGWPSRLQKPAKRVLGLGIEFQQHIRSASKPWLAFALGLWMFRLWVQAICLHLVLFTVGLEVSVSSIMYARAISAVLGWIAMLPMGIGVKDVTLIALLKTLGVSNEAAVLAGVIDRTLWSIIPILFGAISAGLLGVHQVLRTRRVRLDEQELLQSE